MSAPDPSVAGPDPGAPRSLLTRDFALVIAVQLAFGFAFSSFFLLPKFVVTELAGTPSQVGNVTASSVICAVLASPLCGALLDRGARRPLMLAGAAVTTLSSAAFLLVHEVGPFLYALRALQGISFTFFFVSAGTLVADLAPPARLGQALGLFGSAALLMNAIATVAAEQLAHHIGWHAVFLAAAGTGLAATLLSLAVREPERALPLAAPARATTAPRLEPRRLAVYWAAAAGGAAFGVMFTFTQPFALSLGEANVSLLFAGYTASALLVRLGFGNLGDRFGRARVGGLALALYALVVLLTAGLFKGVLGYLGLAFGLAHGLFYPSLNALALERVSAARRGSTTAYFHAAFNGGVFCVTSFCGHLAEAFGFPAVFLLAGTLAGGGALLLWTQERKKSIPLRAF